VVWHRNEACGADFLDLFEPIAGVTFGSRLAGSISRLANSRSHSSLWMRSSLESVGLVRWLEGKLNKQLHHAGTWKRNEQELKRLAGYWIVAIRSDHAWLYPEDFSYLQPVAPIRDVISATVASFTNTVGVHVRAAEEGPWSRESPLIGFIHNMERRVEQDPSTRFYLATDDASAKKTLRQRFGEYLICRDADLSRDTTGGVAEAVIDLWCLSQTREIWGSCGSSFTETAHHLRKAPLRFVRGCELT
jgi:hypothetical protein